MAIQDRVYEEWLPLSEFDRRYHGGSWATKANKKLPVSTGELTVEELFQRYQERAQFYADDISQDFIFQAGAFNRDAISEQDFELLQFFIYECLVFWLKNDIDYADLNEIANVEGEEYEIERYRDILPAEALNSIEKTDFFQRIIDPDYGEEDDDEPGQPSGDLFTFDENLLITFSNYKLSANQIYLSKSPTDFAQFADLPTDFYSQAEVDSKDADTLSSANTFTTNELLNYVTNTVFTNDQTAQNINIGSNTGRINLLEERTSEKSENVDIAPTEPPQTSTWTYDLSPTIFANNFISTKKYEFLLTETVTPLSKIFELYPDVPTAILSPSGEDITATLSSSENEIVLTKGTIYTEPFPNIKKITEISIASGGTGDVDDLDVAITDGASTNTNQFEENAENRNKNQYWDLSGENYNNTNNSTNFSALNGLSTTVEFNDLSGISFSTKKPTAFSTKQELLDNTTAIEKYIFTIGTGDTRIDLSALKEQKLYLLKWDESSLIKDEISTNQSQTDAREIRVATINDATNNNITILWNNQNASRYCFLMKTGISRINIWSILSDPTSTSTSEPLEFDITWFDDAHITLNGSGAEQIIEIKEI